LLGPTHTIMRALYGLDVCRTTVVVAWLHL
jgi:hypothetical protein